MRLCLLSMVKCTQPLQRVLLTSHLLLFNVNLFHNLVSKTNFIISINLYHENNKVNTLNIVIPQTQRPESMLLKYALFCKRINCIYLVCTLPYKRQKKLKFENQFLLSFVLDVNCFSTSISPYCESFENTIVKKWLHVCAIL